MARLPNGQVIINVTPHEMWFWCGPDGVVVIPSEHILNGKAVVTTVEKRDKYTLDKVRYVPTEEGTALLRAIQRQHPDALIVGSYLAAQAYAGEVVSPVPLKSNRDGVRRHNRLNRSDHFTVYLKEQDS